MDAQIDNGAFTDLDNLLFNLLFGLFNNFLDTGRVYSTIGCAVIVGQFPGERNQNKKE